MVSLILPRTTSFLVAYEVQWCLRGWCKKLANGLQGECRTSSSSGSSRMPPNGLLEYFIFQNSIRFIYSSSRDLGCLHPALLGLGRPPEPKPHMPPVLGPDPPSYIPPHLLPGLAEWYWGIQQKTVVASAFRTPEICLQAAQLPFDAPRACLAGASYRVHRDRPLYFSRRPDLITSNIISLPLSTSVERFDGIPAPLPTTRKHQTV